MRLSLVSAFLILIGCGAALASCNEPMSIPTTGGGNVSIAQTTDGNGNCVPKVYIYSGTLKPSYSASGAGTAITITSAGTLANGSAAGSAAIDNTSTLYADAILKISAGIANSTLGSDQVLNIWFSGSEDGSVYDSLSATADNYAGSDAAVTMGSPTVFFGPCVIPVSTQGVTIRRTCPSVKAIFGSLTLPKKWGIIVENRSGVALTSFSAEFTGVSLNQQ